jgi:enoyl-CoA hydratase/carnithine racemase
MTPSPLITVEEAEPDILLVTMRNPPVNAFTVAFSDALDEVAGRLHRSSARAIVLGSDQKHFCAGGDISRFESLHTRDDAMAFVTGVQGLLDRVAAIPAPVIAAIGGAALGGGLELALACDIRIAGPAATLGLPETRWGLLAGAGGTQRLARTVGAGAAKLMMFTADPVDAAEALRIGLVDLLVDSANPIPEAMALARRIARNRPLAVRNVKRCVDEGLYVPLERGLELERGYWADLIPDGGHLEGAKAFFERREPRYTDVANG